MSRRGRRKSVYAPIVPEASAYNVTLPIPERVDDEAITHDYMNIRGSGHNYAYRPSMGGKQAQIFGWGDGLRDNDILLITNIMKIGTPLVYRIARVRYYDETEHAWEVQGILMESEASLLI